MQKRGEHTLVGLGTGVWLYVGIFNAKELFGAVDGEVFRHIHILTPAIVPATRITFGVFVGQHRALRFHYGCRDNVFGGDQFDFVALAAQLVGDRAKQLWVAGSESFGEKASITGRAHGRLLQIRGSRWLLPKRKIIAVEGHKATQHLA